MIFYGITITDQNGQQTYCNTFDKEPREIDYHLTMGRFGGGKCSTKLEKLEPNLWMARWREEDPSDPQPEEFLNKWAVLQGRRIDDHRPV